MQRFARGYVLVVSVLNGLAGLVCGVLFLIAPDGRLLQAGALLPVIARLPLASVFFQDFVWIGIAMLLVLGVPNTVAVVMLIRRQQKEYVFSLAAGVLLALWTGFELAFMYNVPALGYFIVGVLEIAAGALLMKSGSDA
jgi:EamA domain-containing membrane protein RarD